MKFTNGFWLLQEGNVLLSAGAIVDYTVRSEEVILYVAPKKIERKGETLDGGLLTIRYSSSQENSIDVNVSHFLGVKDRGPNFEIQKDRDLQVKIFETAEKIVLESGKTRVEIAKEGWKVCYFYEERLLTKVDWRSTGYIKTTNNTYIREQLDLLSNEQIYGLGERFTPFVKNGQVIDIWNEDGGTSSEQSYKNIPFYVSSNKYGVFINQTEKVSLEVASENASRIQFSVEGESLDYTIIGGENLHEVLKTYTNLTGKPSLPPLWSFGLWLSTSFTTDYDEKTVTYFLDEMKKREIDVSVFHYDCFWMKAFEWCNFEFDSSVFPNPKKMLSDLKQRGLKTCVWINPYIAQKSALFEEAAKQGYLLVRENGDVWQWDKWQAGMGIVDFTNPNAKKWYQDKLKGLVELGVDSFKTDFGERIPVDVVYFDKSNPKKMHNYYTQLYNEAVFEVLTEHSHDDAIVFARSATAGGQKFPVHWGGDCVSTYAGMSESIRGGLSLMLSGFGYWSHDISGFENQATPDVYKRWVQFGLLSTHSRLHGNTSYRVPWNFDDEATSVLKYFTQIKNGLLPYIFSTAIYTAKTGVPSMRPMVLEYTDDYNCRYLDLQYMFGDSLLVAPIFNDEGIGRCYLPKGKWTHLLDGTIKMGPTWIEETYDYFSLPVFVKENSIIPMGNKNDMIHTPFSGNIMLKLFQISEIEQEIFDEEKNIIGKVTAKKEHNIITIEHTLPFDIEMIVYEEDTCYEVSVPMNTSYKLKL